MKPKELIEKLFAVPEEYEICFLGVMVADHEQYLFVEKVEIDHNAKRVYLS